MLIWGVMTELATPTPIINYESGDMFLKFYKISNHKYLKISTYFQRTHLPHEFWEVSNDFHEKCRSRSDQKLKKQRFETI